MLIAPDNERVGNFCGYLIYNYIDEGIKFNPRIWALRKITSEGTTNNCETSHSKLNLQLFTKAHPNISYLPMF